MVKELDSLGGKSGGLPNQGAWVRNITNDDIIFIHDYVYSFLVTLM